MNDWYRLTFNTDDIAAAKATVGIFEGEKNSAMSLLGDVGNGLAGIVGLGEHGREPIVPFSVGDEARAQRGEREETFSGGLPRVDDKVERARQETACAKSPQPNDS